MNALPTTEPTARYVSIIMERTPLASRWAGEKWVAADAICDGSASGSAHRTIVDRPDLTRIQFPGCRIALVRKESEGYLLNISSPEPKVFVLWRMHDGIARPALLSVSYHEGARWMDSEDNVDGVPLPSELKSWIAEYAHINYRPEPKKPKRYASSKDKGRMGNY